MGTLLRYILLEIWKAFLPIWLGMGFLIFLIEWVTRFFSLNTSFLTITLLYLFKLPSFLELVFPPAILFSVLLVLGGMNRNRELVALQAMGYKKRKIIYTTFIAIFTLSIPFYFLSTYLTPKALKQHYEIYDVEVKGNASRFSKLKQENIWYRSPGGGVYQVGYFDPIENYLYDLKIYSFSKKNFHPESIIYAKKALWSGTGWILNNGRIIYFEGGGEGEDMREQKFTTLLTRIIDEPSKLKRFDFNPETLTQSELSKLIDRYRRLGVNAAPWETVYHSRLSILLVSFVFVLLAFPRTMRFRRSGNMALDATYVAVLCFCYWLAYNYMLNLGSEARINPMLAAWTPSIALFFYGLWVNRTLTLKSQSE